MSALFLSAPSGTGKTYAIRKALIDSGSAVFGAVTFKKSCDTEAGGVDVFIAPVAGIRASRLCTGEPLLVATSRHGDAHCTKIGANKANEAHEQTAGVCAVGHAHFAHVFSEAFDAAAPFIACDAQNTAFSPGGILLLDELGRLESNSPRFQAAVLKALESHQKTIGVIQKTSTPFLDRVRQNKRVSVLEFDGGEKDVREKLYAAIMSFIIA